MVHPDGQSVRGREDVYQWYTKEIASIPPTMQEVIERYSGIPPGQVIPHVSEVRDQAFHLFPYPCIGQLRFLNLNLSTHPIYPLILSRLTTQHHTLLDAGCCFGQGLRRLAYDGAPPAPLYDMDLEKTFLDLNHTLFLDRVKMRPATFVD